jgi:hypothetical protein
MLSPNSSCLVSGCAQPGIEDYAQVKPIEAGPAQLVVAGCEIPKDIFQVIFRHLSPEELLKVCQVCRLFNEVASKNSLWHSYDLREVFPNVTFIDKQVWETYLME